jgi:hypothetical protein
MPVVAGFTAFLVLVITQEWLANLADKKEVPLMIGNCGTVSTVLEVFSAVGTGYLAGSLPT